MLISSQSQSCKLVFPLCEKAMKQDENQRRVLLCLGVSFIELGPRLYHQFCTINIALIRYGRLQSTNGRYRSDCRRL